MGLVRSSRGRPFHSSGATAEYALPPVLFRLGIIVFSSLRFADLKPGLLGTYGVNMSLMYGGAEAFIAL